MRQQKRKIKQNNLPIEYIYDKRLFECRTTYFGSSNHFHLIKTPSQNYFRLNLNNHHPEKRTHLEIVYTQLYRFPKAKKEKY